MVREGVREGKSAGSPEVRWAPGVGANGGARRDRARPRHTSSRDRRSRVRQMTGIVMMMMMMMMMIVFKKWYGQL